MDQSKLILGKLSLNTQMILPQVGGKINFKLLFSINLLCCIALNYTLVFAWIASGNNIILPLIFSCVLNFVCSILSLSCDEEAGKNLATEEKPVNVENQEADQQKAKNRLIVGGHSINL